VVDANTEPDVIAAQVVERVRSVLPAETDVDPSAALAGAGQQLLVEEVPAVPPVPVDTPQWTGNNNGSGDRPNGVARRSTTDNADVPR
jgi:hypothetical protein